MLRYTELGWLAGSLLLGTCVVGCAKPCDPIPESETVKRLGIVLEGGRVCKEDKSVATIDYPSAKPDELTSKYTTKLGADGWKAESPSEGTILATKAEDTLFIVTGKKSKDRRVPFAIVRYCEDSYCRKQLTELAAAMGKYK